MTVRWELDLADADLIARALAVYTSLDYPAAERVGDLWQRLAEQIAAADLASRNPGDDDYERARF